MKNGFVVSKKVNHHNVRASCYVARINNGTIDVAAGDLLGTCSPGKKFIPLKDILSGRAPWPAYHLIKVIIGMRLRSP